MSNQDEDSGTRTGLAGSLFDKTRTSISDKKIQIRMVSRKVYGPYTRTEVVGFIVTKRLTGEEEILFEGDSDWKPISSDLEFFDLFQKMLVQGTPETANLPEIKTQNTRVTRPTAVIPSTKKPSIQTPPKDKKVSEKKGETQPLGSQRVSSRPASSANNQKSQKENPPNWQSNTLNPAGPLVGGNQRGSEKRKIPPLYWAVGFFALAGTFFLFSGNGFKGSSKTVNLGPGFFLANSNYAKPLKLALQGLNFDLPVFPQSLEPSAELDLPLGFSAEIWTQDLESLNEKNDPKDRLKSSYWARWIWNSMWIGAAIQSFDFQQGSALIGRAKTAFDFLLAKNILDSEQVALFGASFLAIEAKWDEALLKLKPHLESQRKETAMLLEEISWQNFWSKGGKGEVLLVKEGVDFNDSVAESSHNLKKAFLRRDAKKFNDWVLQTAQNHPTLPLLWFATAQTNWRLKSDGAQLAFRLFLTGLGTSSLLPKSFQDVYWMEFASFLETFGRFSTAKAVVQNLEILRRGQINPSKNWVDLGSTDLNFSEITEEIKKKASSGPLGPRETATLVVLSLVLDGASDLLLIAGQAAAFEGQWFRAENYFERLVKSDPKSVDGWGGLLWARAGQFSFDKAFEAYDEIEKLSRTKQAGNTVSNDSEKFLGLLQKMGREYDEAEKNFRAAIKLKPNDGWSHYFLAEMYREKEKFIDCIKAANLGRVHGRAELAFRADLLFYDCRVRGKVDIKSAIADLRRRLKADPENISLILAVGSALAHGDQLNDAIGFVGDQVLVFPRSFELRMLLGDLYTKKRDLDRAVLFFTRASKDNPTSALPSMKIGKIFYDQSKFIEAARNFEGAAISEPTYPEAWLWAARSYAKGSKAAPAIQAYLREIEERPAVLATFIEAAEYLLSVNAPQEVPKLFQKFTSTFQDDPRVLTRLAQAYLALKDFENAERMAKTVLATNPNIAEAYRVLGYVFENQAQYENARSYFEKYLQLLPQAGDAAEIQSKLSRF